MSDEQADKVTAEKDVWICTHSGTQFFPFCPRVTDIHISDISHALSNIGRYTGHTSSFYSVAQHSVWVSYLVPPEHALCALLHDASEAYLADIPRPMKPHFPRYEAWELELENVVAVRFGLPFPHPPSVKAADTFMLRHEIAWLFPPSSPLWQRWEIEGRNAPELFPASPAVAKMLFQTRYRELTEKEASGPTFPRDAIAELRRQLG